MHKNSEPVTKPIFDKIKEPKAKEDREKAKLWWMGYTGWLAKGPNILSRKALTKSFSTKSFCISPIVNLKKESK